MNARRFFTYIVLVLVLTLTIAAPMHVTAASPTPSPSATPKTSPKPSASPTTANTTTTATTKAATSSAQDSTVQQNIKDRIEKILDEKDGGAAALLKRRAYVGRVQRVTTESLALDTLHGEVTVKLSSSTSLLLLPKLQSVQVSDIEINGFVIVMGYMDGDDVLDARRVLVTPSPLFPLRKKVVFGTVDTIKSTEISVLNRAQETVKIPLSTRTTYENKDGETAKRTDVKADMKVLVITPNAEDASVSASLVRITE